MIHSIGKENFGLYTLAMSVISVFVFDFGLSSAVTRFIAKYIAEGRVDKANNCLGLVYKLYFAIDIILFVALGIVYFFIPQIYDSLTPEEISKFKVVYIIASIFSIISFPFIPVNGVLSANEKFIQLKSCDVIHKFLIVAAMSTCLVLGYGLYALVLVNVFAGVTVIILKLYFINRYTKVRVNFKYRNSVERNEILSFSGWTTIISLSQRMIFNIAPSILGIYSGSASIAILGIAITIEGYVFTFANAINGLFLPKVSKIFVNKNAEILPLMIKVGRIQTMIIGAIIVGFACLGQNFIDLWVGPDFSDSFICALLIIVPSFVYHTQQIASTAIIVQNKVKKQALVYTIMACCNILLALILSKYAGPIGICSSICVAYCIRAIGMNIIYYRDLNINVLKFFNRVFKPVVLPLVVVSSFGIFLNIYINSTVWIMLILKAILLYLVLSILYWYVYMNEQDKDIVKSILIRKR